MEVAFRKIAARRYAVVVRVPGMTDQTMNPAPGYDEHIPHDLVHYAVEAELKLTSGVYGRAASGGGTFFPAERAASPREQARQRRKQARREQRLTQADRAQAQQMAASERFAFLCDIAWRRRHGQRPDPARWQESVALSRDEQALIERVVARLDQLASAWKSLEPEHELTFDWPNLQPTVRHASR